MPSVKTASTAPRLQLCTLPFAAPAQNLACDEALLDLCDASAHPGFLRFWESPAYFVVLGYGKHLEQEVYRDECRKLDIPIFRRCSGGGTVLQGPGCLNYMLVLPIDSDPELASISSTNRFVMERTAQAITRTTNHAVTVQGHTDLVWSGRKFSGNAQRRKRRCFLFHGTFLLNFDLEMISRTLRPPAQQPDYREGRLHADFIANFPAPTGKIQAALAEAWEAWDAIDSTIARSLESNLEALVQEKYSTAEWNERF